MGKNNSTKKPCYERPAWKWASLVATILSGVSGLGVVAAIIIAIIALNSSNRGTEALRNKLDETVDSLGSINKQMGQTVVNLEGVNKTLSELTEKTEQTTKGLSEQVKILGEQTEIAREQLEESRKRPFISLAFLADSLVMYSIPYDSVALASEFTFELVVVNSGLRPSEGGKITITIPKYLSLIDYSLIGDRGFKKTDTEKGVVLEIEFGRLPVGRPPKRIIQESVLRLTLKMITPDVNFLSVTKFNNRIIKGWKLEYEVGTYDWEGTYYNPRTLWLYFLLGDADINLIATCMYYNELFNTTPPQD